MLIEKVLKKTGEFLQAAGLIVFWVGYIIAGVLPPAALVGVLLAFIGVFAAIAGLLLEGIAKPVDIIVNALVSLVTTVLSMTASLLHTVISAPMMTAKAIVSLVTTVLSVTASLLSTLPFMIAKALRTAITSPLTFASNMGSALMTTASVGKDSLSSACKMITKSFAEFLGFLKNQSNNPEQDNIIDEASKQLAGRYVLINNKDREIRVDEAIAKIREANTDGHFNTEISAFEKEAKSFECPINKEIMEIPVYLNTSAGNKQNFDSTQIELLPEKKCPITRDAFTTKTINTNLDTQIKAFIVKIEDFAKNPNPGFNPYWNASAPSEEQVRETTRVYPDLHNVYANGMGTQGLFNQHAPVNYGAYSQPQYVSNEQVININKNAKQMPEPSAPPLDYEEYSAMQNRGFTASFGHPSDPAC